MSYALGGTPVASAQVGDTIKVHGAEYVVIARKDLGELIHSKTGYRHMLGLRKPKGKITFAMNVTDDGRYGNLVSLGR